MTEANRETGELQRAKRLWSRVPYDEFGRVTAPAAADIVDFVGVARNESVLDVACGTGNTAITAARHGADVTGIDLNQDMLEGAERNAEIVGVDVEFRHGDAMALPVEDDTYDVVLSTFGHHLASDRMAATRELARVTRPGGRVGYAAYALTSVFAEMFRSLGTYHPELTPEEAVDAYYWGDSEFVAEQFGGLFDSLAFEKRRIRIQALSPTHVVEYLLESNGPVRAVYEEVDDQTPLFEEWVDDTEEHFARNAVVLDYLLVQGTL